MRALVLSGGAVKGAYQLGVLRRWMGEEGLDYQIITGVSVGALNAAGLAMTPLGKPKEAIEWLINFWLEHVETDQIYTRWFPFGRLHSLWEKSIYDSRPLMKLVRGAYSHEKIIASGKQISVGAVNLVTGEHRFVRETDRNFVEWILASSSFPVFMTPIEIENELWSDGGIRNVTPLGQAISMGATEVDVITTGNIWTTGQWRSETKRALPDQVLRVLDLMNDQIMRDDIKITGLKNDLADLADRYRHVRVRMVMPSGGLVGDSLKFNKDEIRVMLDRGYNDADKFQILE